MGNMEGAKVCVPVREHQGIVYIRSLEWLLMRMSAMQSGTSCSNCPETVYKILTGRDWRLPSGETTLDCLALHIIGFVKRFSGGRGTACTLYLALTSRSPPTPAKGSCDPPASPSWYALPPATPSFYRGGSCSLQVSIIIQSGTVVSRSRGHYSVPRAGAALVDVVRLGYDSAFSNLSTQKHGHSRKCHSSQFLLCRQSERGGGRSTGNLESARASSSALPLVGICSSSRTDWPRTRSSLIFTPVSF